MRAICVYFLLVFLPVFALGQGDVVSDVVGVDFPCLEEEICDNGIDDDGDGFVDCDDLDCLLNELTLRQNEIATPRINDDCPIYDMDIIGSCILDSQSYFENQDIKDAATAINICNLKYAFDIGISGEGTPVVEIDNGFEITCSLPVAPNDEIFEKGPLIAETEYRHPHSPPNSIAPDMVFGIDGDSNPVLNKSLLEDSDEDLFTYFEDLLRATSIGQYETITLKYLERFRNSSGESYGEEDLSELILQETITKNFIQDFAEDLNEQIIMSNSIDDFEQNPIDIEDNDRIRFINMNRLERVLTTADHIRRGPAILMNDTEYTGVYKQSFNFDENTGEWEGVFYIEVIDHFGLDPDDLVEFQTIDKTIMGIESPFEAGDGFASWWMLQHLRGYQPFITKVGFIVCINGEINP